ncbi:HD-GYP domain-containing protein [Holophaga foetida]|uniref:HD-GYP domain-containing protein n=1 Tax=Holophaga foetida TaxID=35839 RepID=UPI0002473F27|nr:HD-GYP domain-containing protein [Holophaga foetida]
MIKKVRKEDLKLGMYIHDLNCGWMDHNFFRSRFMLRKEEDLQKIHASGITELYIDTVKGIDADGPTQQEVEQKIHDSMTDIAAAAANLGHTTSHKEELAVAKAIHGEANKVIHSMLTDVRLGKQIQVERMEPVVAQVTDSILRNQGTLVSLCRIKEGDTYTFQHSVSVCALLVTFCRYMGMDRDQIQLAGMGGMLHDIGKMRVPDHILNKPGKLTDEEFGTMKSHVTLGLEVLQQTPGISPTVFQVTGQHHEKFKGAGYPLGLADAEISTLGKMAAIVDVYDAITSNRVYHRGMEPGLALSKLFEWGENHFDPALVQHFIQALGIYPVGSLVKLDSERLAVVVEQSEAGLLYPVVRVVFDIRRNQLVSPVDLDLSRPESGGDSIVGNENPESWRIDPFRYLTLAVN